MQPLFLASLLSLGLDLYVRTVSGVGLYYRFRCIITYVGLSYFSIYSRLIDLYVFVIFSYSATHVRLSINSSLLFAVPN